jgi:cytochrome d ubiquinol oxidase subunit I
MFSMAMWMATLVAPLQILAGDQHGLNTLEHQPAKIAAMEGHYETKRGAPLILFGVPDDEAQTTRYAIEIPKAGSLILKHDPDAEILGLDAFPADERPPAIWVFFSFRLMVGIGILMLGVGLWALWRRFTRRNLYEDRWLHRTAVFMGPMGFIAILAGWVTTEVGRQPFTVYGLLRTSDSLSPVQAPAIATSLIAFVVVYTLVFGAGIFYILRMMRRGPDSPDPEPRGPQRAAGITPAFGTASDPEGEAQ